ncbi:MAG: class I SAM-dependent RNA methyltransferase [Candidatus Saccharimonadales bacterium]
MKILPIVELTLDKIVGGGQTLGSLDYGKKAFVWGGLPGEKVSVQLTKKKSSFVEGVVVEVLEPSSDRVAPIDEASYLSTSPWQIMKFEREQHYKAALIEEAFELHDIVLPGAIEVYSDNREMAYRNKLEFSWWWDKEVAQLDLAFFRRGTHGKIPVDGSSLADPKINAAAHRIRDTLRMRDVQAYVLKTLLIRSNRAGEVVAQLYVKDEMFDAFSEQELRDFDIAGFELIFSNPKSPASVITKRLQAWGQTSLTDTILDVPFTYAVEGFFQINLPVYEQALRDMREWIPVDKPAVDLYSGVGTIGLTIGGDHVTMVEINEHAVREMERNITALQRETAAKAILAPSETALEHITTSSTIIVDPPRAGLHEDVVAKLLTALPDRIVYLSCNPVTQARDVALLCAEKYGIRAHRGYNIYPRTPHLEHLVVLDRQPIK